MNLTTYKKFRGDRLMPWGKATVVTAPKGLVFLCGNTATTEDYDPANIGGCAVDDPAAHGLTSSPTSNRTWRTLEARWSIW